MNPERFTEGPDRKIKLGSNLLKIVKPNPTAERQFAKFQAEMAERIAREETDDPGEFEIA